MVYCKNVRNISNIKSRTTTTTFYLHPISSKWNLNFLARTALCFRIIIYNASSVREGESRCRIYYWEVHELSTKPRTYSDCHIFITHSKIFQQKLSLRKKSPSLFLHCSKKKNHEKSKATTTVQLHNGHASPMVYMCV